MSLRRMILDAVAPQRDASDDDRRAIGREIAASNQRAVRALMPFLIVLHVGSAVFFARMSPETPAHRSWLFWLVRIHMLLATIDVGLLAGALRDSPRAQRWLGDAVAAAYLLFGGLMSANAQRTHAALNAFIFCAFGAATIFRAHPVVFCAATTIGVSVVSAGALRFQSESVAWANIVSAIAIGIVAVSIQLMTRAARIREWLARLALERANAALELRADAKVRERSEEISRVLQRLAETQEGTLAPGTVLEERFVIESALGFGGMGDVYRAFDKLTSAPVAIKVIQAHSARELDGLHRFLQEARAMASVRHPAIRRSLHVDISGDGRLFQALELIEGQTLDERIKREGAMKWPHAARLIAVLADALAAAHAAGIVHRDIKPANVMLTRSAPGLKLLDFGISKLKDASTAHRDETGQRVLGTPEYMAPEQILAAGFVGGKADVYSLGLLSYECMTGKAPFRARTPMEWMEAHTSELPADLAEQGTGAPHELTLLVMGCLQKDPEARPTAAELARAMGALADREKVPSLEALERAHTPSNAPPPAHEIAEGPTLDATEETVAGKKT